MRAAGLPERGAGLNLSEWKVPSKVLLPAVLPYMLTGVRLSIVTAWLVIVVAEDEPVTAGSRAVA